ncbi:hypothetical protein AB1Y20_012120 [Prymnesium parvum]|uniref:RING-type E3 ubiquitin transferase n=1 Tax=Prymnesium parvum TaxID=97485 RepID=A0AB34IMM7_PRYPA
MWAYTSLSALLCAAFAATSEAAQAPTLLSALIMMCGHWFGQLLVVNLVVGLLISFTRLVQWLVFGRLRMVELTRLWERLINYTMGQLVVLGAVVEPDLAELLVWLAFAALVGFFGLYSGLCRDRLDYLSQVPDVPSRWVYVRVLSFLCAILATCVLIVVGGVMLMWEAGLSTLSLLMFQCCLIIADSTHTLMQFYLQRRERRQGSSDLLYYASLIPEVGMQCCRLCHHLHVWYVHGLAFSVIDILLLANTKAAFETLRQLLVTHLNFLRADANLQHHFRSATRAELDELQDCCAICRDPMESAKVLPCGHFFHYRCLRSWLEQSHSCPICRASLTAQQRGSRAAGGLLADGSDSSAAGRDEGDGRLDTGRGFDADMGEEEGEEEEGDEGDEQSFLLFSSENWRWPSWMPGLHLEVIRRRSLDEPPISTTQESDARQEELSQLREVFPQLPEVSLRRALLRSSSLETAIEQLLQGFEH